MYKRQTQGKTLYDILQEIYKTYGYYVEKVVSVTLPGKDGVVKMKEIMKSLRENPPKELAGKKVLAVRDYLADTRTDCEGHVDVYKRQSEHRAIVFKMNRKQAAAVARYLKEHSASPETIFAVDVDTMELIVQAKNAGEEDIIVLDGEEDVFDVEEEVVEENEEVWEAIDEALSSDEE